MEAFAAVMLLGVYSNKYMRNPDGERFFFLMPGILMHIVIECFIRKEKVWPKLCG